MGKKIKKLLVVLLTFAMCISLLPAAVLAVDEDIPIDEEHFPDANFLKKVKTYDADRNDFLSTAEIEAVTEINVNANKDLVDGSDKIESLVGIEHFTNLTTLECTRNKLTELDLSKNNKLETLICWGNKITNLNLKTCTSLQKLNCNQNNITELILPSTETLAEVDCSYNRLKYLDVSSCNGLKKLKCRSNYLTSINLSHTNCSLGEYDCDGNVYITSKQEIDVKDLPGTFDKSRVERWCGATLEGDTVKITGVPNEEKYMYSAVYFYKYGKYNSTVKFEIVKALGAADVGKGNCKTVNVEAVDSKGITGIVHVNVTGEAETGTHSNNPAARGADWGCRLPEGTKTLKIWQGNRKDDIDLSNDPVVSTDLETSGNVYNNLATDWMDWTNRVRTYCYRCLDSEGNDLVKPTYFWVNMSGVTLGSLAATDIETGVCGQQVEASNRQDYVEVKLSGAANLEEIGTESQEKCWAGWGCKLPYGAKTLNIWEADSRGALEEKANSGPDAMLITASPGTEFYDNNSCDWMEWNNRIKWYCYEALDENERALNQKTYFKVDMSAVTLGEVKVSFDENGGSGTMEPVTISGNPEYTLPGCDFAAPEGKEFDKWDKGAVGEKIAVNGDMILTAQWRPHEHDYGPEYEYNSESHWQKCDCGAKSEETAHTWKWVVEKEATATEPGSKHEECTVCGYAKKAIVIPAAGTGYPSGGGDFGGVTPSSPGTEITLPSNPTGGSITSDKTKASEGDTVTITATPEEGYETQEITVTDNNGNPVEVIDLGNNRYSFKVPKGGVKIEASFNLIDTKCDGGENCPSRHLKDVDKAAWYHEAVDYVVVKALMKGTSATTFEPNTPTSRAMIVTILYRLEGSPKTESINPFKDVENNSWYTDAVVWAADNQIVKGYGNDMFGPNDSITREQMAAILYRYSQYKGYNIEASASLSKYTDSNKIDAYALAPMNWAVAKGLIQGMSETGIDPLGNAVRSQVAAILMRFCEGVAK